MHSRVFVINENTKISEDTIFDGLEKGCDYCDQMSLDQFLEEDIQYFFSPDLGVKAKKERGGIRCTLSTEALRRYICDNLKSHSVDASLLCDAVANKKEQPGELMLMSCSMFFDDYGLRFFEDGWQYPEYRFLYSILCNADKEQKTEITFFVTQIFDYHF